MKQMMKSDRGIVYPKVVDYACGAGHFLTEAIETINYYAHSDSNNEWVRDHIYGIEKDYRLARVSKISLFMNGAGDGNIIFGDGLENAPDKGIENGTFDILVANPPYAVKDFKQHLQLKNNSFTLLERIGLNGSEIETLFVERIGQLLKPRGIAAVILPSSILSNSSASYTGAREQFLQNFYIRAVVAFGSETFGATGTNTVVMFLEKFDEPPKRIDLSSDSVDAIMDGAELTEWEDKKILEAYMMQIKVKENEYRTFLHKEYSLVELRDIEYFKMYIDAFANSADAKKLLKTKAYKNKNTEEQAATYLEKFYEYAYSIEREKLFYFSLVYQQTTVVITAPAGNKAQKNFLGYDWSERKGSEGIRIITLGGKMYDNSNREAQNTLASAVRESFADVVPTLSEEQKKYASVVMTKDMLDFSRANFNKNIRLKVDGSIVIDSKYKSKSIQDIFSVIESGKRPDGGIGQFSSGVLSLGGEHIDNETGYLCLDSPAYVPVEFYENATKGKVQKNDILICKDGARTGKVAMVRDELINRDAMLNEHVFLLRSGNPTIQYYVFQFLFSETGQKLLKSYISGSAQGGLNSTNLKQIKIPMPPEDIMEQIVSECEKIDEEYNTPRMSIERYQEKIEELFDELGIILNGGIN